MKRLAILAVFCSATLAQADLQTFGFDDGTYQGWEFVDAELQDLKGGSEESEMLWKISIEDIDLGENDWDLLQGSTVDGVGTEDNPQRIPNYRIIPEPWANRDCIGIDCLSMIFRSPIFKLDDSGSLSVDIMGGQGAGDRNVMASDELPFGPEDLRIFKNDDSGGLALQGFALYDVAEGVYVEFGFPTFNNDGKERDGRGVWETVEITAEDLAPYANDGKDYRLDIFDSLAGGWGWIGFDTVRIPNADFVGTLEGDCDASGALDAGDLQCVSSLAERDIVLAALNTLPGDLDGIDGVAFADFLTLSGNFGNAEGTYAEGNIDLEGGIAFSDFLILSGNFGQTAAATASVPEPGSLGLSWAALLAMSGWVRRRTRRQTL